MLGFVEEVANWSRQFGDYTRPKPWSRTPRSGKSYWCCPGAHKGLLGCGVRPVDNIGGACAGASGNSNATNS